MTQSILGVCMNRIKPYIENKYHVSTVDKHIFLYNFKNVITADENAKDGRYYVSSLYFDTENFDFFLDKQEGEFFKIKIRIRRYSQDRINWTAPKLELKMKVAEETIKISKWISEEDCHKMAFTSVSGYEVLKILNWNEKCPENSLLNNVFRPKARVIYERDAYNFKGLPGLRLTFDHNIYTTKFNNDNSIYFSEINNIFEVKSDIKMPLTFSEWLKKKNIMQEHISKYSIAIEKLYKLS